jgi:hypothetical protein
VESLGWDVIPSGILELIEEMRENEGKNSHCEDPENGGGRVPLWFSSKRYI